MKVGTNAEAGGNAKLTHVCPQMRASARAAIPTVTPDAVTNWAVEFAPLQMYPTGTPPRAWGLLIRAGKS